VIYLYGGIVVAIADRWVHEWAWLSGVMSMAKLEYQGWSGVT